MIAFPPRIADVYGMHELESCLGIDHFAAHLRPFCKDDMTATEGRRLSVCITARENTARGFAS
jgi:hypothetical protein